MTRRNDRQNVTEINAAVAEDEDLMRRLVERTVQEVLEAEMTEALGAGKGQRTAGRLGYRSGHYPRNLVTRVGPLELRVPQDREGRFSTDLFERYQRSEKALVAALAERYVQGVSTRKVKAVTEELCGHAFSASAVSAVAKRLDAELQAVMERPLGDAFPYVYLDARYEKVRESGVVRSRAVLVAIGVDGEGKRQVLGVELAHRESTTSWKDFLVGLKARGLHGVVLAVSDSPPGVETGDHGGVARSLVAALLRALFAQRPGLLAAAGGGRRLPDRTAVDVRAPGCRGSPARLGRLAAEMGGEVPEAVRVGGGECGRDLDLLPPAQRAPQAPQETNVLERLNQELKRRTNVVRIFPHEASCLRLVRALAVEIHEEWAEGPRYLDLSVLPAGAGCTARLAEAA